MNAAVAQSMIASKDTGRCRYEVPKSIETSKGEDTMFSLLVIFYLFLGGCGGGLIFVSALGSFLFHRDADRTTEATRAFANVKKHCFFVALLILLLAAGSLVADLGRPERMFMLFTRPTSSILTFGSFVLLASILLAGFLVIANYLEISWITSKSKKVAEIASVICAMLLITYTGVYLQQIKAVPFWDSALIPLLFICSSLSAGIALELLIIPFSSGHEWLEKRTLMLHKWHVVILILEAFALVAFVGLSSIDGFKIASLQLMFGPELGPWFIFGACGAGLFLPLIADSVSVVSAKVFRILPVELLCLFGAFCLRYCIVSAGLH